MFHAVEWSSSCCAEAGAVPGVLGIAGVFQLVLDVSIYAIELTAAATASQAALSMSLSTKSSIAKDSTEAGS